MVFCEDATVTRWHLSLSSMITRIIEENVMISIWVVIEPQRVSRLWWYRSHTEPTGDTNSYFPREDWTFWSC